jgi:hypothetical protein
MSVIKYNGRDVSLEYDINSVGSTILVGAVYLDDGTEVDDETFGELENIAENQRESEWLQSEGLTRDMVTRVLKHSNYYQLSAVRQDELDFVLDSDCLDLAYQDYLNRRGVL